MEQMQRQLRDEFKRLPQSALDDPHLPERLSREYGLNVPVLDENKKHATTKEVDIDVSQDQQRLIWDRSKPFYVRGTEITIHVPFEGDAGLFEVRPATHNVNPPLGEAEGQELRFLYRIIEPRDISPEFERTIGEVKQHLDWLHPSADQLKAQLQQQTNALLGERKQRTEAHGQILSKLGIPIKQEEARPATPPPVSTAAVPSEKRNKPRKQADRHWDVFISHASEDKEAIARPLADALTAEGLAVWYDEFSLKLGDSLRESIDRGLARSRYGVVILSPHFFEKHWPQKELNGLATREVDGEKVILPVWHNVGFNEVRDFSPTLADLYAVCSDKGLEAVVKSIQEAMK
jgi:hypothetical protein